METDYTSKTLTTLKFFDDFKMEEKPYIWTIMEKTFCFYAPK